MLSGSEGPDYLLRTAQGSDELEAVFQFRYEHFFHCFPDGYPGLDHTQRRIFETHDLAADHYCAFDSDGKLCAVSTATPADAKDIPTEWRRWFQLAGLSRAQLGKVVVSTRMVIRPGHRHSGLFVAFYDNGHPGNGGVLCLAHGQ
jgi:putative hemolysin